MPPRDPRGVRVQYGDEILVGRAVIKVIVGSVISEATERDRS